MIFMKIDSVLLMDSCPCVHQMNTCIYQLGKHRLPALEKSEDFPTARNFLRAHHHGNPIIVEIELRRQQI